MQRERSGASTQWAVPKLYNLYLPITTLFDCATYTLVIRLCKLFPLEWFPGMIAGKGRLIG